MRTLLAVLVSALLAAAAACDPGDPDLAGEPDLADEAPEPLLEEHEFADPDVTRVHSRMISEMAPDGGWERARYLEFDWVVPRPDDEPLRRSHRWDRWGGLAEVRMPVDEGEMVAAFPVDDPHAGRVRVNGEELEGDEAREALERANRTHINDSYWFLMPYKWADPGVRTEYLGRETDEDGREWEVVELSFEDVGITPDNVYRAFINPETGLMERWHYLADREADPSPSDWTGWEEFGPISLATRRERDGELRIGFEAIRVLEEVPEDAFEGLDASGEGPGSS